MVKQRIKYIDLTKGFCIILVVSLHIDYSYDKWIYGNADIDDFFRAFRMPLYFFISGFFLSFKDGYKTFIQKKINRLLIPFIFFVLLTNLYNGGTNKISALFNIHFLNKHYEYISPLYYAVTENPNTHYLSNGPLWFLISLFITYLIYAFIHHISLYTRLPRITTLTLSLICGCTGLYLGQHNINLPLYIDTSLTCFPFLYFGTLTKQFGLLEKKINSYTSLILSLVFFFISFISCNGICQFYINSYDTSVTPLSLYTSGLAGSIGILLLCKLINKIPIISVSLR